VPAPSTRRAVALVTLGCARNEVDSEELAARLALDGWDVVAEPASADAVLVNTCGFVDAAKKDSIDTLLAAAEVRDSGRPRAVVAVGCLAERYGAELAAALPEADAVLGFDAYDDIGGRLRSVVDGDRPTAHQPRDRRRRLPVTPIDPTVPVGTTLQFAATGLFSDGSTMFLNALATWASSDEVVATVSDSLDTKGLTAAHSPGTTVISATFDGVTGVTTLTVTP